MAGLVAAFLSPGFLIYAFSILLVTNAVVYLVATLRPKAFPPGPRGLPGFGNLLQLNRAFPYLTLSEWAKYYGKDTPIGVKKGASNVVVLNSGRLVRELFDQRGAVYSDRPWQYMNNTWVFKDDIRAAIQQNNSAWLTLWRKEFTSNFGQAAVTRHRPIYDAETARLLVKLLESPNARKKDLETILVCWMMSAPTLGVCGRRPDGMEDLGFFVEDFIHCSDEYSALTAPHPRDVFPLLQYLPEFFGMAEWKIRARALRETVIGMGTKFVNAAEQQREALDAGKPIGWESVLARMLKQRREKKEYMFTTKDIGNTAFHTMATGWATSLATLTTILMLLAKDPELQQKMRNEVLEVTGGATPKPADVPKLKYMEAFWYEAHRWRPVAPQAFPHATSQDDIYNGFRIPRGTAVIANVWNIHHSEEDYEEPEKFIPERFLRHPFGMRSHEGTHDPARLEASGARVTYDFGAGRRICPGMYLAKHSVLLGLAKMIWAFDILPPKGKEIDLDLETGYIQEVALRPKDFDVSFRLRVGRAPEDITNHYSQAYEAEAKVMGWEDGQFK
ncbi:uncharacterized protein N0V89_006557 [Didymosphaeria variabile]|uniref:Cytochrome P450 n=1 Tax=Didymosphaeria variabile TaxID=1932322 RepID=A0A9W9C9E4_9PLEO|nr:uncharacterized protein N0V89_006557 [Didymosphaeria variabile]KAJ4351218.1 hypothetical protein N0V89_006557 [Didymosphaeria variabile]